VTARDSRRHLLLTLLRAALAAVDGRARTRAALEGRAGAVLARAPAVRVAAVGKAAAAMARGAHDALGARMASCLVITKDGHVDPALRSLPGVEVLESGHPVPDQRSLDAGARLLAFVRSAPPDTALVLLVSGGASSLAEVLAPGATLEDLRGLNLAGLASGVAIGELNARRRDISLIKGGRLLGQLGGRPALALLLSDVPGDDPAVIGSGLAAAGPAGPDGVERVVVASIKDALCAVRTAAAGLEVEVSETRFSQDAERLAVRFAHELHFSRVPLRVWGGESVVRLPPQPGRGGRNQHLALAVARIIAGDERLVLLAAGTDGTDGVTDDAGALVDGDTCARAMLAGLDVEDCLRRADSATALAAAGDLVHTGPTGTNVGDLVIGLKLAEADARAWLAAQPAGR